jgi:hypothetical protein
MDIAYIISVKDSLGSSTQLHALHTHRVFVPMTCYYIFYLLLNMFSFFTGTQKIVGDGVLAWFCSSNFFFIEGKICLQVFGFCRKLSGPNHIE